MIVERFTGRLASFNAFSTDLQGAAVIAAFSTAGTLRQPVLNVSSITDNAAGSWTVNLIKNFASVNTYVAFSSGDSDEVTDNLAWGVTSTNAGNYTIESFAGSAPADPATGDIMTVAFGEQV